MSNDNNLSKTEQKRGELEVALSWRIVPQLNQEIEYRVTIAYTNEESKLQNIKILGLYKGYEVSEKILRFFDKFLADVNDFGLLLEARNGEELKNWDISFSKVK